MSEQSETIGIAAGSTNELLVCHAMVSGKMIGRITADNRIEIAASIEELESLLNEDRDGMLRTVAILFLEIQRLRERESELDGANRMTIN